MSDRARMKIVRSLRGGKITLPAQFRRELGIEDDTLLQVTLEKDELRVRPMTVSAGSHASLRELHEHFAPVREEIRVRGISEEEVNVDINAALYAVRHQNQP